MPEKTRLLIRVVKHPDNRQTDLFLTRSEIIELAKQGKLKWDADAGFWRDVR
jgi:hypothetical protein